MSEQMNSKENSRLQASKKITNCIDPVYWFLDRIVFKNLFVPRTIQSDGSKKVERMEESETSFLLVNLQKHRLVLWLNLITLIILGYYGYDELIEKSGAQPELLVAGLLAPAMVTGAAWFAISFGGISEKFLDYAARDLTFALFAAFTLSLTLLSFLLVSISPWQIGIIVVLVYIGIYYPCILYDNLDGLKVGLDTTMLKFSRASLNYYQKHGLVSGEETQAEQYEDNKDEGRIGFSGAIVRINLSINQMRALLEKFETNQSLVVANEFIASIIKQIFDTLSIELNEEDSNFIRMGYSLEQDDFDEKALKLLSESCEYLKNSNIGELASQEIKTIGDRIEKLRSPDKDAFREENDSQKFADFNFSQILNAIVELLAAYKHLIAEELGNKTQEERNKVMQNN